MAETGSMGMPAAEFEIDRLRKDVDAYQQREDEIIVALSDRREREAVVVGTDPLSDLALLKIDADDLPEVEIGSSDALEVGEWVMAIGSPFGFELSVTVGVVSAKGRSLPDESGNYVPYIQTDVAINPGNSGGPLFNLEGKVVGINSQIFTRSGGFMGLSFAIPIDVAMEVVDQLRDKGFVSRELGGDRRLDGCLPHRTQSQSRAEDLCPRQDQSRVCEIRQGQERREQIVVDHESKDKNQGLRPLVC